MGRMLLRTIDGVPVSVSRTGSKPTLSTVDRQSSAANAIRDPSRENVMLPHHTEGAVTGSGEPRTRPESSSIGTRQRFIVPPRSLEKYRYRPSGDHTGLQSSAASSVTDVPSRASSDPSAALVQISRCPELPRSPQ